MQDLAERGPLDDLHNPPEHVGGHAVLPDFARLMHERKRGHGLDIFRSRPVHINDVRRLDQLLDGRGAREAVGQARRVAHQVLHGDRPLERREIKLVAIGNADLHIGESGDVFRDWIGDQKASLLDQHHRGHGDDGLGHRIDAEDRVVDHGGTAGPQRADRLAVGDMSMPGDQHRDAGRLLLLDLASHDCREPLEPLRNKAQRLGRSVGKAEGTHQTAPEFQGTANNGPPASNRQAGAPGWTADRARGTKPNESSRRP